MEINENIRKDLFAMQDLKYRDFNSSLIPTVDKKTVIGVRTPELKKYAKVLAKNKDKDEFMAALPHDYYEENNLHAFLICEIKDYADCIKELNRFLPYVDNWATCDSMRPKCFSKNKDRLVADINKWLLSGHDYTIRYGIGMLLTHFLDEDFNPDFLKRVSEIQSEEYYVNMMIAWYFATALAKQWDNSIPYISGNVLSKWVHNKTIQKAVESYRITSEQKDYLRSLRRK